MTTGQYPITLRSSSMPKRTAKDAQLNATPQVPARRKPYLHVPHAIRFVPFDAAMVWWQFTWVDEADGAITRLLFNPKSATREERTAIYHAVNARILNALQWGALHELTEADCAVIKGDWAFHPPALAAASKAVLRLSQWKDV